MIKPLRAIIIDDEPNAIFTLQTVLQEFCEAVDVVGTANGALEGVKLANKLDPEIVFLDVDMPGGNGFDFLDALPNRNFKVIFTTASSEYAIKALKARAEDYLLKPVDIAEIQNVLEKLRSQLEANAKTPLQKIALPIQGGFVYANTQDIIHISNDGNYTTFYMRDNTKQLVSKNIGYFTDMLPSPPFFRCHQSHIINLQEVKEVNKTDGTHAILSNGNRVEVSRANKDAIFEMLST